MTLNPRSDFNNGAAAPICQEWSEQLPFSSFPQRAEIPCLSRHAVMHKALGPGYRSRFRDDEQNQSVLR
jgi:hypothetical protein